MRRITYGASQSGASRSLPAIQQVVVNVGSLFAVDIERGRQHTGGNGGSAGYTCPLNCRDPSEKDGNEVNRSVLQGLKELTEFGYATKIPVQISFENARREA